MGPPVGTVPYAYAGAPTTITLPVAVAIPSALVADRICPPVGSGSKDTNSFVSLTRWTEVGVALVAAKREAGFANAAKPRPLTTSVIGRPVNWICGPTPVTSASLRCTRIGNDIGVIDVPGAVIVIVATC